MRILEDRRDFFDELKKCYLKEGKDMWCSWESLNEKGDEDMDAILFYMAFSLGRDVLHGPLPDRLHNRMVLSDNGWCRAYIRYLAG